MDIISALNVYASGKGGERELDFIFSFCKAQAIRHFSNGEKGSGQKFYRASDSESLSDMAANSLSHLWCPPDKDGLAPVARIWISIIEKTGNIPERALFYFSNTIKEIVLRARYDELRANRPQEWKLRRSLRQIISRMENYQVCRRFGQLLISRISPENADLVTISKEKIERHCYHLFEGTDSLQEMVIKATRLLNLTVVRGNAFRLEDLASIITEFNVNVMSPEDNQINVSHQLMERIHLRNLLAPVFSLIRNKIRVTYVDSGKLSAEMAEIYLTALKRFLDDFINTGSAERQFEYLADQVPEMDMDAFKKAHKARFGYLVAELKTILEIYAQKYLLKDKPLPKQA